MTRLWHCFNCSTDFEAEAAVCSACGAENEKGQAQIIAQRLVVHYDPPHPKIRGRGKGFHACNTSVKVGTQGMRATGYCGSVTCPACKMTEAWKAEAELLDNPMAYRVPEASAAPVVEQATVVNESPAISKE